MARVSIQKNRAVSWKLPFSAGELACLLDAMLEEAGCGEASLELSLMDDAGMERLHEQSMGCPSPTNILSFNAPAAAFWENTEEEELAAGLEKEAPSLGWLALSADALLRECLLYGQDEEEHCLRLLAHGLAHLLGLDHSPAMDSLSASLEQAALERIRNGFACRANENTE